MDGTTVTEIPSNFHGNWENDEIKITSTAKSIALIELNNNKPKNPEENIYIHVSDSCIVKTSGKYCVLNLKSKNHYQLIILKSKANRIEVYRPYINDKRIKGTNLKILDVPVDTTNASENTYVSGQITSKQLKQIIDKKDKMILLKDGTIETKDRK
ncbi:MAG: hypothetical protein E6Q89_06650 [Bacteroidia bacterium]|nr:MAG: hypothetical protein E6Q89_06650 [Bacteroidia bacterium]